VKTKIPAALALSAVLAVALATPAAAESGRKSSHRA